MKFSHTLLLLVILSLAIVCCASLWIDKQPTSSPSPVFLNAQNRILQPTKAPIMRGAAGGSTTFPGCVNTTSDNCRVSTCAHYTCKTIEDARRININNVNIKCEKDSDILQCVTHDGTRKSTYCGCAPIMPSGNYNGKPCPDGLVVKTIKAPCLLQGMENLSLKTGGYPTCKPSMPKNHTVCTKVNQSLTPKPTPTFTWCTDTDNNCVSPPPQAARAEGTPAFENCVDTRSKDNCKSSCVHYTCKTPGDAKRINIDNVNIKCDKGGEREYDFSQCKTVGNITYCGCAPLFASGGVFAQQNSLPKP